MHKLIKNPTVSVIIPCYNEEKYIEACVRSVFNGDYPLQKLEVIVVDGNSEDKTQSILFTLQKEYAALNVLSNPKKVTPVSLNIGLKKATGDVKIILGAHSEIAVDFISQNIAALTANPQAGCAGGLIENVYENETAKLIGRAMASPFGVGNATFRIGGKSGFVDTVAFGAYRREVFEKIGYFDEELVRNQDDEFNFRMLKNGFKIYFSTAIKCKYFVRSSYSKLKKQYYQYGYWKVYVNQKHKAVTTLRQVFPALFTAGLFLGFVLSFLHPAFLYIWLTTIFAYLSAAVLFALRAQCGKIQGLTGVLGVFFILHLYYGAGYLAGVFDFFIRNKKPAKKHTSISR